MTTYYHDIDSTKANMRIAAQWALDWFWDQCHERPASVAMHPDTARRFIAAHGWPLSWPPLIENPKLRRGRMVMNRAPVGQMQLL